MNIISQANTFFSQKTNMIPKKHLVILSFLGLYMLTAGGSFFIFSFITKGTTPGEIVDISNINSARSRINLDLPKTESCPINGKMYTKIEKDIWEGRRPIAAMIENHADSRPPSGLSKADVIYEAVAEGGITRFLSIFYCGTAAGDVKLAPVRSARIYFVNWATEYGNKPLFVHVGGANNFSGSGDTVRDARALEHLESLGWRVPKGNDFDTTYDSGFPVFWRNYERLDHEVATEHTMMVSTDAAYEEAEKRDLAAKDDDGKLWSENYIPWKFSEDKPLESAKASKISFKFWDNKEDYDVEWQYEGAGNRYLRVNGGKPHTDLEYDKTQLSSKNVVVMFVNEKGPVDRNYHMLYTTVGRGKALVFQNGDAIDATWEKASAGARTKFFDSKGSEMSFVKGEIWIEAIPNGNEVDY